MNFSFEIFDSVCNKFTLLKAPQKYFLKKSTLMYSHKPIAAISIGSNILVFTAYIPKVLIFDVVSNKWSKHSFEATKNISIYCCENIPQFYWSSQDEN